VFVWEKFFKNVWFGVGGGGGGGVNWTSKAYANVDLWRSGTSNNRARSTGSISTSHLAAVRYLVTNERKGM